MARPVGQFNKRKLELLNIIRCMGRKGFCNATSATLAAEMKVTTRQICRYLKALRDEGLIAVESSPPIKSTIESKPNKFYKVRKIYPMPEKYDNLGPVKYRVAKSIKKTGPAPVAFGAPTLPTVSHVSGCPTIERMDNSKKVGVPPKPVIEPNSPSSEPGYGQRKLSVRFDRQLPSDLYSDIDKDYKERELQKQKKFQDHLNDLCEFNFEDIDI